MLNRVVITGMGVVSPNAVGINNFKNAILEGKSGIKHYPELEELNFRCQLGGIPDLNETDKADFLKKYNLTELKSTGIMYGCMAGVEAWADAGLAIVDKKNKEPDWESGCIFGTGSNGIEATDYGITLMNNGDMRKGDQTTAQQTMNSGVSAYLGGILGLGNQVTSNSSACNTGTEAALEAYNRIKFGMAQRMVVGSSESNSPYVWGPFDSMFALAQGYNATPDKASCPMSKNAMGFVPSAGAGALVIESLESATNRNAKIYAEILGGHINSGGQRGKGTMTIGNVNGMAKCIQAGLSSSGVTPKEIDLISGHLTSTIGDVNEIQSWKKALKRSGKKFPWVNSTKSMIGHSLSAAGSIEIVASVLQLYYNFVHPSLNVEELHPEIEAIVHPSRVPKQAILEAGINIIAKINFGFGDVNSCLLLKKWSA